MMPAVIFVTEDGGQSIRGLADTAATRQHAGRLARGHPGRGSCGWIHPGQPWWPAG
jgi:hypothetical protein